MGGAILPFRLYWPRFAISAKRQNRTTRCHNYVIQPYSYAWVTTVVTCDSGISYGTNNQSHNSRKMPLPNHLITLQRKFWSAVIVAVAVASLTMSVATRYYSLQDTSSRPVSTVQKQAVPDARPQRLTKNAAVWSPPVLSFAVAQVPSFHPRIDSARPLLRSLVCDTSLYNRPPPAPKSFL